MAREKVIFISAPFNNVDKDTIRENVKQQARYAVHLLKKDICFVSPILTGTKILDFYNLDSRYNAWSLMCVQYIDLCTEVHILDLPGWNKSKGVLAEIRYAQANDKKIFLTSIKDYSCQIYR